MQSVSQMLELAVRHHQAGDLHQAELLYRQILQIDPQNVDALHLLGLIAHQVGKTDLAVDYIQQALRLHPEYPAALNNLGNVLKEQGKLEEAIASYRQAVHLKPDHAEAHYNLGIVLRDQGKLDEAVASYRQALHVKPHYADVYINLGNLLRNQGKLDETIATYRQALRLLPHFAEAHYNLGNALCEQGKLDEAIASYRQAVLFKPDLAVAYNNLANTLRNQGKLEEAIACYRQVLRLKPDHAEAHHNLGNVLRDHDKLDEAIACYRQALHLSPNYADAYNSLGNALRDQGKLEEAIASYRQAVRLKPDFAEAYNDLGNVLKDQRKLEEAAASYRQAIQLKPDIAASHCNLATLLLLMGDYTQGWQEYEWRWQTRQLQSSFKQFAQPLWRGESLHQGTILLHAEQGLGDTIQVIRLAARVKQRVGTVLCECPPSLARLLRSCAGIDRVIPIGEPPPLFDVHAPLMSLPGILNITLETIPASVPYLMRGEEASLPCKASLPRERGVCDDTPRLRGGLAFKIGIVWQGNPKTFNADLKRSDRKRSISLAHFERLARVPGVRLFSLQKGFGTEQLAELAGRFAITDLGSTCDDFSDTAAVMKNLDLVISVDTAAAHLAGALGVPVWVPLPPTCCWRWLTHREDSPWYPTMRLFRQTVPGDWSDVFERMAQVLHGRTDPAALS